MNTPATRYNAPLTASRLCFSAFFFPQLVDRVTMTAKKDTITPIVIKDVDVFSNAVYESTTSVQSVRLLSHFSYSPYSSPVFWCLLHCVVVSEMIAREKPISPSRN